MSENGTRDFSKPQELTVIVELSGGLANQLFQWAVGFLLSTKFDARMVLDARIVNRPDGRGEQVSFLTETMQGLIDDSKLGRAFWSSAHSLLPRQGVGILKRFYAQSTRISRLRTVGTLDDALFSLAKGRSIRMRGLFQSADYLHAHREIIVSEITRRLADFAPVITENYVSIHVRRGDYVSNPKYNAIFGTCSEEYYCNAISRLDATLPIVIVTDDAAWAERFVDALDFGGKRITVSSGKTHFHDLATLAGASELALSNSTFSWWGAFLGDSTKTICPDPWFTDVSRDRGLQRPGWVRLPR